MYIVVFVFTNIKQRTFAEVFSVWKEKVLKVLDRIRFKDRNLLVNTKRYPYATMKVSVLLCLTAFAVYIQMNRAQPVINCATKRWHGMIGCQQIAALNSIKKEIRNNEKCMCLFFLSGIREVAGKYVANYANYVNGIMFSLELKLRGSPILHENVNARNPFS